MSDNDRSIQNAEAEADHLAALARAEQAVISAAVAANDGIYSYDNGECWMSSNAEGALRMAIDEWRALGGVTTEERA